MKKHVLWSLALGATLTASVAAVLHGCGTGISPVEVETGDGTSDAAFAVSPTTGNIIGGFTLSITPGTLTDLSGATVTVGGQDCPQRESATASLIKCRAPALAAGTYDVVVTTSSGSQTLTSAVSYGTTIKFSRDIQPLFDEPLYDSTLSNNVSCVFCHSLLLENETTSSGKECDDTSGYTNAPTAASTDCHGRGDASKFKPWMNSSAAGQSISHYSKVESDGTQSVDRAWNDSTSASAGGRRSFPIGSFKLASAFSNTISGYTFDCATVKTNLVPTGDTNGDSTTDARDSKLYRKLNGNPITNGSMPRNKSDNSGGDSTNDNNLTYDTPLRDAQRNPVAFSKTDVGTDADPTAGADGIPDKGTQLRALLDWCNYSGGACTGSCDE